MRMVSAAEYNLLMCLTSKGLGVVEHCYLRSIIQYKGWCSLNLIQYKGWCSLNLRLIHGHFFLLLRPTITTLHLEIHKPTKPYDHSATRLFLNYLTRTDTIQQVP
jgi:hypothetical protein